MPIGIESITRRKGLTETKSSLMEFPMISMNRLSTMGVLTSKLVTVFLSILTSAYWLFGFDSR